MRTHKRKTNKGKISKVIKENSLWIFLHVPKTGGTTFSDQIKKYLKSEEVIDTSQVRYGIISGTPQSRLNKVRALLGHATYYGIHKMFPDKTPKYVVFFRDPADRIVSAYNFEMRTKTGKNLNFWKWYKLQSKNDVVHFMNMKFHGLPGTKANMPDSLSKLYSSLFKVKAVTYFFQRLFKNYFDLFTSEKEMRRKLENSKKLLDRVYHIGFIPGLDEDLKILFKQIGISTRWENTNVTPKSQTYFKLDETSRKKLYQDNKYDKELFDYALSLKAKRNVV